MDAPTARDAIGNRLLVGDTVAHTCRTGSYVSITRRTILAIPNTGLVTISALTAGRPNPTVYGPKLVLTAPLGAR